MLNAFEAARFIEALVGDAKAPVVFQLFDDCLERKKNKTQREELNVVLAGPLLQHLPLLQRLQNRGAAICLQINEGERGADNITAVRALFVDDDDGRPLDRLLELTKHCPPSVIVGTAHGHHLYWLLLKAEPKEEWKAAQRQLARALETDTSVTNLDRVMRLPGTLHLKDPNNPAPTTLVHSEGRRYRIEDVLAAYPLPQAVDDPKDGIRKPKEDAQPTNVALRTAKRVREWLDRQGVKYRVPPDKPTKIILTECIFNHEHGETLSIHANTNGSIWAGCFHDSCGGNQQIWPKVKEKIGGWLNPQIGFAIGDHVEIGRRALGELRGEGPQLVGAEDQLWRYEPAKGIWQKQGEADLSRLIMSYSGLPIGAGTKQLKIRANDVKGIVETMRQLVGEPGFFYDTPRGIAFANGFLRLDGTALILEPHTPELRQRYTLPFPWSPDSAAPRFARFLDEIFAPDADAEAKKALLQEFTGACLIGVATRMQTSLTLLGEGANGKSVFLEVVSALFPPGTVASVRPQDFGREFLRAHLAGKRINVVNELPESDIIDAEAFKAIVDGVRLGARMPFGRAFEFNPECGQLYACNRLPGVVDFTHGFWRKCLLVTLNRRFSAEERDLTLAAYLIQHELPGICAWALGGATRALARGGYTIPPSTTEAMQTWRRKTDVVLLFLDECTRPANREEEHTTSAQLYAAFREWCGTNGHRALSHTNFGERAKRLISTARRGVGIVYGVALTVNPPLFS